MIGGLARVFHVADKRARGENHGHGRGTGKAIVMGFAGPRNR